MSHPIKDIYKNVTLKYLKPTPLRKSEWLSKYVGGSVYLKLENCNPNGSFKVRGALNALSKICEKYTNHSKDHPIKVAAASAGNHSQGVAYAAKQFKCEAHIFLPVNASPLKVKATKDLGAKVYMVGNNIEEALKEALKFCEEEKAHFINPFNDINIIEGQATCALESHTQFRELSVQSEMSKPSDPDYFVCSIGGGGLASGACLYFSENAKTKVIGVEQEFYNSAFKSLHNKSLRSKDKKKTSTIADGIAVKKIGSLTFKYLLEHIEKVVTVSENDIYDAVAKIYENENIVVEGAGGASVSAVLKYPELFKQKSSILCISGGNIDPEVFQKVLHYSKDKV